MKNESHVVLTPWTALSTNADRSRIMVAGGDSRDLTLEDLGNISERLAVAWENIAGEQYKPVIISERGYVAQGSIAIEDAAEIASRIDRTVRLERDCE
mgnify:CR=1 FL=1